MVNTSNQNITWNNNKLTVLGKSLKVGEKLPNFALTGASLEDIYLNALGIVQIRWSSSGRAWQRL